MEQQVALEMMAQPDTRVTLVELEQQVPREMLEELDQLVSKVGLEAPE